MRPDKIILQDSVDYADGVLKYTQGVDEAHFLADDLLQSAVQFKLLIIGEATTQLTKVFRDNHPEIPCRKVAAYRNLTIHGYFTTNWEFVWKTSTVDCPVLRDQVCKILASEFPA